MRNNFKGNERLNEERLNNQGCLMKIVEYNNNHSIILEFQDKYKGKVHTNYKSFSLGETKNPYYPSICGIGITGNKYPTRINNKKPKEYAVWTDMIRRCFDIKEKENFPTYKNATCCDEWLLYDSFYEWLHKQENFEKWYNGSRWDIDKDILFKGNKIYSPETCCLTPNNVNQLFVKRDNDRGDYPVGVHKFRNGYRAQCRNPFNGNKQEYLGIYSTFKQAFNAYKIFKENIIKQVAEIEYKSGNITKQCYEAMMNYEIEITD